MLSERGPFNLANLVVGSEGTLAVVVEASVRLVPQPKAVVGVAGHFETVAAGDRRRRRRARVRRRRASSWWTASFSIWRVARPRTASSCPCSTVIRARCCGSSSTATRRRKRGRPRSDSRRCGARTVMATPCCARETSGDLTRFRELRKAGLGLLSAAGERGERSVAFVEDTAVDPTRLGEYTHRFAELLERHGLEGGLLRSCVGRVSAHPAVHGSDEARCGRRRCAQSPTRCARSSRSSAATNSSEHGDGLVRSEFNAQDLRRRAVWCDALAQADLRPARPIQPGQEGERAAHDGASARAGAAEGAAGRDAVSRSTADGGMRGAANRCARIGACRKSELAGTHDVPVVHGHARRAALDARSRERARARAVVAGSACGVRRRGPPRRCSTSASSARRARRSVRCRWTWRRSSRSSCRTTTQQHGVPLRARVFGHVRTLNRVGVGAGATVELGRRVAAGACAGRAFRRHRSPPCAAAVRARDAAALVRAASTAGARRTVCVAGRWSSSPIRSRATRSRRSVARRSSCSRWRAGMCSSRATSAAVAR